MDLVLWFLLLVVQNASFTWVSRARNSGSVGYHALASVFSNGVWFVSQFLLISMVVRPGMPVRQIVLMALVYIAGTVSGAALMHYVSLRFLEKGKRKVGG